MSGQRAATGKVLVLGGGTRAALAIVRSLGRRGMDVHLGWERADSPTLTSRYLTAVHPIAKFSPTHDDWKRDLIDVLGRERFDLVIPCVDMAIIPVQQHRAELEQIARFALLNDRAFEVTRDKAKTGELARELGIPLPEEVHVRSSADLEAALERFRFPIVLKPLHTYEPEKSASRNSVVKAYDRPTARRQAALMLQRGELLAQENVAGRGVGIAVLADRGRILYHFQHRRLHEPLHGGGSSYRTGVPTDAPLLEAAQRLMEALDYTGVGLVEFKYDEADRSWALMEINGRFWGSLPLAVASGADFPYFLYANRVHGITDFPRPPRLGLYARNTLEDIRWLRANARADRRDPTLATVPWRRVAWEGLNLLRLRERNDTFVWDDPRPAIVELARWVASHARQAGARIAEAWEALPPIRRMVQRRLARRLRTARNLLFVCKGNICRSPFAEGYVRLRAVGLDVSSCGYFPESDRACPDEARQAAGEIGVELISHRSRPLSRDLVEWSDLILVFDREGWRQLRRRFPTARARLFPITALGPLDSPWIEDPAGGDREIFRACYRRIADAVNGLLQERLHPLRASHGESGRETSPSSSSA